MTTDSNSYPAAKRLAARFLSALALVAGLALPGAGSAAEPAICPVPDPDACLTECRVERGRCLHACRAEKGECIVAARHRARICKLDCRHDDTVADVGECRRDCVKKALRYAIAECDLGNPVCLRRCHPTGCIRECGLEDTAAELHADAGERCIPPSDRPCLGACARRHLQCVKSVRVEARECVTTCSELDGEERSTCLRRCAEAARTGSTECRSALGDCTSECRGPDLPRPAEDCAKDCRGDLGACLDGVWSEGRECVSECSNLEGDELRACSARCKVDAEGAAGLCEETFRSCLVDCKEAAAGDPAR